MRRLWNWSEPKRETVGYRIPRNQHSIRLVGILRMIWRKRNFCQRSDWNQTRFPDFGYNQVVITIKIKENTCLHTKQQNTMKRTQEISRFFWRSILWSSFGRCLHFSWERCISILVSILFGGEWTSVIFKNDRANHF